MQKISTITKNTIAKKLKDRIGFSIPICEDIVSTIFSEIINLAKRDQKVMLTGFGTWKINNKKERPGFDILAGNPVNIKSRSVFRFIASKAFRDKINKHYEYK